MVFFHIHVHRISLRYGSVKYTLENPNAFSTWNIANVQKHQMKFINIFDRNCNSNSSLIHRTERFWLCKCVCVFGIDSFSESHILFEHYTFYIVFSNISHLLLPLKFDEFISESGFTTVEMWKSIFEKRFVLTQIHLYSIHFCNVLCYMFCGQFQK